jgi:hypothetical protein
VIISPERAGKIPGEASSIKGFSESAGAIITAVSKVGSVMLSVYAGNLHAQNMIPISAVTGNLIFSFQAT